MATTIQLLIGGLALGSIYALVALGLYITHLTVDRVNFGQGDFVMAAAFLLLTTRTAGLPLGVGIVLVMVALAVMGWALERIAIRPLDRMRTSPLGSYSWILTTAGVAFIVQNVIELVYGKSAQYSPPLFSDKRDVVVQVLGVGIVVEEILLIAVAITVVAAFYAFMFKSRWGKNILAVAFNPETASLLGIDTRSIKVGVFIIAAVMAAVAGVLIGPLVTVHPHMGLIFTDRKSVV